MYMSIPVIYMPSEAAHLNSIFAIIFLRKLQDHLRCQNSCPKEERTDLIDYSVEFCKQDTFMSEAQQEEAIEILKKRNLIEIFRCDGSNKRIFKLKKDES